MKQYVIREISVKGESENIKIGENDILRIYEIWRGKTLEEQIEDIIKINLPLDDDEAMEILKNGKIIDGVKYVALATTVGMMKHEDSNEYSCEYFFINKEQEAFIEVFEDVVSLGKIKEKYNTELCINKDIISRLSLAFSTGERVHIPNLKIAILPEMTYTYVNNYLQFAENKEGQIDLNNLRLEKKYNEEVKHIAFDGSGFITPNTIDYIQKELNEKYKLNIDYPLSWIGIREIGLASKGLLVRFDFKQYLREEHGLNELWVKDMWGENINLFDVDVIMNESQVKWGKWFLNQNEIEELKKIDKYKAYHKLFQGFNITKYNKKEANRYTEANYQILSNLALTPRKLDILSKESENIYERVINRDVDAIRIMLGDIAREDQDELSASTRVHQLLQLDEKMIRLQSMYKVVGNLVNKKVNNLAGGGLYLKGNYKTVIKDAISYMDSIVEQKYVNGKLVGRMSSKGLQDGQNYVPGETGKRVLARCPLNSATEIIKTELVSNRLYDKYFGDLSNDICFYPLTDFMARQSGEDEDLDISFVIDEDIIYNSVIDDIDENGVTWYFRNQFDGVKPHISKFTKDEMYKNILEVRGNKIGRLSNKGSAISNLIQELPYFDKEWDDYFSYSQIRSQTEKLLEGLYSNKVEKRIELKKRMEKWSIKNKEEIKNNKVLNYTDINDEEIIDFIKSNFQKYKIYSYFTLYLQMVAIDSVKTNIKVTKEQLKVLNEKIKGMKKPLYIYYSKYKKEDKTVKYEDVKWSNTLLNNYAQRIIGNYGSKARSIHEKEYNNDRLFYVLTKDNDATLNEKLLLELTDLNNKYNSLRDEVDECEEIKNIKVKLSTATENKILDLKEELIELKTKKYNEIDVEIAEEYKTIKEKYDYKEILIALNEVKSNRGNKVSSRFIIEFCFEELVNHLLKINHGGGTWYKLDQKGDVRYLYENYIKENCSFSDVNLSEKELIKKKEKLGQILEIRVGKLTHNTLTDMITIEDDKISNEEGELLGCTFKKVDIESGTYKVDQYDYKTKSNNEYELAKSMSIYVITA